jgi:hypothetical protein
VDAILDDIPVIYVITLMDGRDLDLALITVAHPELNQSVEGQLERLQVSLHIVRQSVIIQEFD